MTLNPRREKAFRSNIVRLGMCKVWTGTKGDNGRGKFMVGRKTHCAQRLAYELFIGEIPKGSQVHTMCNNRECLNDKHMFLMEKVD